MNITILSLHLGFGGIERCVSSLANILSKKYNVEIICSYKILDKPAFYINPSVNIKYLMNEVPNRDDFKKTLKNKQYIKTVKEMIKGLKILKKRKNTMIEYISNCSSDVIISTRDIFNDYLGTYGKSNVLKIGWEHNHYNDNMKYAENVVRCSTNLDYLVLVSNSLNEFYKEKLRKSKCKTKFIPNIIEYVPDDLEVSNLKEKRMISIGRLSKEKGFLDLLKIFSIISKKHSDWCLDIIGDGDEKNKLLKYIKENNLSDKVKLHGFRDKDYIYNMFGKSSIYLMTSYTESFGIVLIEAMSAGIPCVAFSSANGANEIISSGDNGYIIKNRNFDAYIKKVEDLINDYDMRCTLGSNARRTIMKYTPEVVGKMWFDLIEKK